MKADEDEEEEPWRDGKLMKRGWDGAAGSCYFSLRFFFLRIENSWKFNILSPFFHKYFSVSFEEGKVLLERFYLEKVLQEPRWQNHFLGTMIFESTTFFGKRFVLGTIFGNLRDNMTNLNVGGFRKNTPRVVDLKKSRYWRRFRRFDEIATKNSPWSYILLYTIYMVLSKSARPFLFSGVHFFSGFGHSKEDFIRFMSRFRKRSCWRHWRRNHASASLTELQFLFRDCSGAV